MPMPPAVRRLRRAEQARLADLPDQLRAQPLQRAGLLRQPPGQPAGLSRPAGRGGRGQILCEHVRVIQRSHKLPARTIYDWRHYLAVIQRKPGALRNGAPFAECPRPSGSCRSRCCKHARAATARWSRSSPWCCSTTSRPCWPPWNWPWRPGVPTKTHVLNLLHRLIDGKVLGGPPPDRPPQALT
jgi:hypothetical protein